MNSLGCTDWRVSVSVHWQIMGTSDAWQVRYDRRVEKDRDHVETAVFLAIEPLGPITVLKE